MKKYDVVGIGNAIVDCLAQVDDAFLRTHGMARGSMQLITAEQAETLHHSLTNPQFCSGGSVANSIAALASLGMNTAFLGRVADDRLGENFTQDIRRVGVTFTPVPATKGKPTASCIICVTPDGERTMNTFIGACAELTTADIHPEIIEQSHILYIEGYMWDAEPAKEAILHAVHIARDHGVKIAFSTSDAFCVNRHRAEFLHLIHDHVDILFANAQEAHALHLGETEEDVATALMPHVEIVVITRSEQPALIATGGELYPVATPHAITPLDATGAGDLFAAGFLHGVRHGKPAIECAMQGHRLAGHIIQQLGARSATPLPILES
jgi:sugar/nucleoside kinase (ribokinase family)